MDESLPDPIEYDLDDLTDEEWALFVSQGLDDELNDERQDVYTLDDGTPLQ